MRKLLSLNKPEPGPGTYNPYKNCEGFLSKPEYKLVIVQCFFKGAERCSVCGEHQFGDYYRDAKRRRPLCWCHPCYRAARPLMTPSYLATVRKYRHCSCLHKHIDVKNITYQLVTHTQVRRLALKEKALWNKYGEIVDSKGLPV